MKVPDEFMCLRSLNLTVPTIIQGISKIFEENETMDSLIDLRSVL